MSKSQTIESRASKNRLDEDVKETLLQQPRGKAIGGVRFGCQLDAAVRTELEAVVLTNAGVFTPSVVRAGSVTAEEQSSKKQSNEKQAAEETPASKSSIHTKRSVTIRGGALDGQCPRVIISTDIGGSDPDDFQSLVHLLLYADVIDVEGLISSPPHAGRTKDILEVVDAYANDYSLLKRHSKSYPAADSFRRVTKQGAVDTAPAQGWAEPTEGSRWIVQRAHAVDQRPLWILVWGSLTDVAQAVHDDPSIKSRLRVYSIGSWNTKQDSAARDYLFHNHADLWWIENDTTFRGMYMGGIQNGEWGNRTYVQKHVKGHGALGDLFFDKKRDMKMGDTPSLLYLLRGDINDPAASHWGGSFVKTDHGENYWTDRWDESLVVNNRPGAKSVSDWRRDYLEDWKRRMDRAIE